MTIRTLTRRPNRTLTLPALALAGALTLSACGGGDGAAEAPTDEPASQGTTDSATDDGTADDGATDDDTADDDATDDADDTTGDADGAGATGSAIRVQVEGQGVKLLRVVDDGDSGNDDDDATSSDDDGQQLDGKLISGPGGCLALQPGGKPQLILVDDDDAVLGQSPPTLTLDDTAYKVGDEFPVEGTAVTLSDVEGVPDQCAQGADAQAWLVDD